jgi:hypothetical protein
MHTVEQLEHALARAKKLGYKVQQDWLDGCGGGCEIGGQKWIYLDLALSTDEQLEQVLEVLSGQPMPETVGVAEVLAPVAVRKSA